MAALSSIFQAAHVHVDNQQVKDNLQREQVIKVLITNVNQKEQETKQVQENKEKAVQTITSMSKG